MPATIEPEPEGTDAAKDLDTPVGLAVVNAVLAELSRGVEYKQIAKSVSVTAHVVKIIDANRTWWGANPPRAREQRERIEAREAQAARSISMERRMASSGTDAIKLQIQSGWSLPAGARDAENLVVKLRLFLNPDGSLARAPEIVDRARMNQPGQEFFRTAAESAVRAVRKCEPLRLPPGKYDHWREMVLTFDPRDMFGG